MCCHIYLEYDQMSNFAPLTRRPTQVPAAVQKTQKPTIRSSRRQGTAQSTDIDQIPESKLASRDHASAGQQSPATGGLVIPGEIIQTKLKVGTVDDPCEREADAIADAVVAESSTSAIEATLVSPVQPQRKCAVCAREDEEPTIRLKKRVLSNNLEPGIDNELERAIQNKRTEGGRALDSITRTHMESRLGADFSRVKVHDDASASAIAKQMQARAFTIGHDIFFGPSEYRPTIHSGRRLIAHELAHVLQQRRAINTVIRRKNLRRRPPKGGTQRRKKRLKRQRLCSEKR